MIVTMLKVNLVVIESNGMQKLMLNYASVHTPTSKYDTLNNVEPQNLLQA